MALCMVYELYIAPTFHEERTWNRLLVISAEDVDFGDTQAPVFVKTMYDLHKEYPYMDRDRSIFFMHATRYMCRCQKEHSTNHIKNIIVEEFEAGYVPEIPEYAIDTYIIKGRAMGRDALYFLDEASKVQSLQDEYDDSCRLEPYEVCKEEAEQKREDK